MDSNKSIDKSEPRAPRPQNKQPVKPAATRQELIQTITSRKATPGGVVPAAQELQKLSTQSLRQLCYGKAKSKRKQPKGSGVALWSGHVFVVKKFTLREGYARSVIFNHAQNIDMDKMGSTLTAGITRHKGELAWTVSTNGRTKNTHPILGYVRDIMVKIAMLHLYSTFKGITSNGKVAKKFKVVFINPTGNPHLWVRWFQQIAALGIEVVVHTFKVSLYTAQGITTVSLANWRDAHLDAGEFQLCIVDFGMLQYLTPYYRFDSKVVLYELTTVPIAEGLFKSKSTTGDEMIEARTSLQQDWAVIHYDEGTIYKAHRKWQMLFNTPRAPRHKVIAKFEFDGVLQQIFGYYELEPGTAIEPRPGTQMVLHIDPDKKQWARCTILPERRSLVEVRRGERYELATPSGTSTSESSSPSWVDAWTEQLVGGTTTDEEPLTQPEFLSESDTAVESEADVVSSSESPSTSPDDYRDSSFEDACDCVGCRDRLEQRRNVCRCSKCCTKPLYELCMESASKLKDRELRVEAQPKKSKRLGYAERRRRKKVKTQLTTLTLPPPPKPIEPKLKVIPRDELDKPLQDKSEEKEPEEWQCSPPPQEPKPMEAQEYERAMAADTWGSTGSQPGLLAELGGMFSTKLFTGVSNYFTSSLRICALSAFGAGKWLMHRYASLLGVPCNGFHGIVAMRHLANNQAISTRRHQTLWDLVSGWIRSLTPNTRRLLALAGVATLATLATRSELDEPGTFSVSFFERAKWTLLGPPPAPNLALSRDIANALAEALANTQNSKRDIYNCTTTGMVARNVGIKPDLVHIFLRDPRSREYMRWLQYDNSNNLKRIAPGYQPEYRTRFVLGAAALGFCVPLLCCNSLVGIELDNRFLLYIFAPLVVAPVFEEAVKRRLGWPASLAISVLDLHGQEAPITVSNVVTQAFLHESFRQKSYSVSVALHSFSNACVLVSRVFPDYAPICILTRLSVAALSYFL